MTTATETPPIVAPAVASPATPVAAPALSSLSAPMNDGKAAVVVAAAPAPAAVAPVVAAAAKPAEPAAIKPETVVAAATPPATDSKPVEITLKAPEGSPLSAEDIAGIQSFAKDNGLSQAQAEKIMARDISGRTAASAQIQAQADAASAKWRADSEAHPVIGGANLKATVAEAQRALAHLLPADRRQAIADSPYANHPDLLLLLKNAAALLPKEDVVHPGSADSTKSGPVNPAHTIYAKFAPKG